MRMLCYLGGGLIIIAGMIDIFIAKDYEEVKPALYWPGLTLFAIGYLL